MLFHIKTEVNIFKYLTLQQCVDHVMSKLPGLCVLVSFPITVPVKLSSLFFLLIASQISTSLFDPPVSFYPHLRCNPVGGRGGESHMKSRLYSYQLQTASEPSHMPGFSGWCCQTAGALMRMTPERHCYTRIYLTSITPSDTWIPTPAKCPC